MESIGKAVVIEWLKQLKEVMIANAEYLSELDGRMGDGDLGLTMSKGFSAAYDELSNTDETDIGKILAKAGMTIASKAPSTMGTLMGTGFMRGGKALRGKAELSADDLGVFFTEFVDGLMDRGKAKPGEKTVIDALYPVLDVFGNSADRGLPQILKDATVAAEKGLEATREMVAEHGRIAYYKDQSRGQEDPGAAVGVLLISALANIV